VHRTGLRPAIQAAPGQDWRDNGSSLARPPRRLRLPLAASLKISQRKKVRYRLDGLEGIVRSLLYGANNIHPLALLYSWSFITHNPNLEQVNTLEIVFTKRKFGQRSYYFWFRIYNNAILLAQGFADQAAKS
jgi:hypothetical protein